MRSGGVGLLGGALLSTAACLCWLAGRQASAQSTSTGPVRPLVVVVKGTHGTTTVPSEASGIERYHGVVAEALAQAGVAFETIRDEDVAAGKLAGTRLAVLPYNPRLAPGEAKALKAFTDGGGKVLALYAGDRALLDLLGLRLVRHLPQERPGDFASIRFTADAPVAHAPPVARQASWNIFVVEPARAEVTVAATWFNAQGRDTGRPAVLVGPQGAYLSHVLLNDDLDAKAQMMLALVGHFVPTVWRDGARTMAARAQGLLERAQRQPVDALTEAQRTFLAGLLVEALRRTTAARRALDGDHAAPAWAAARDALAAAEAAFYATFPTRAGEFRGVWIHTAYGVADWGWEKSAAVLAANGFTAVVPNVCFAGMADYHSAVLDVDPRVAEAGDQVSACVAAAHKHGLQVHAWRVNFNLGWRGPKAFAEKMRAAGRLQRDPRGNELNWLCPSHPDNLALERDAMLELARNYDLDGIHFDYIRYPGPEGCYCDGCRERFEKQLGRRVENWPQDVLRGRDRAAYLDFRRQQITNVVATVAVEARKIKPGLKISAAVFSNWSVHRDSVGQDWPAWVEKGYVDFVCPMNYTSDDAHFERLVRDQVGRAAGRVPVYPGIGAGTGTPWTATPEATIRQILLARQLGAGGFMIFQYTEDLATRFLPALHAGVTRKEPPR